MLILQTIAFLALGVALYVVARALPRINDAEIRKPPSQFFQKVSFRLEKVDGWLQSAYEKFLRRLRVAVLKFENSINKRLSKFRKGENKEGGILGKPEENNK